MVQALVLLCSLISLVYAADIIVNQIEQFGPTDDVDLSGMKVRKDGKDRKLFGNWTIHRSFDDSYIAKLVAFMKTGSGWNLLPYKVEKPVCEFHNEDIYFYKELAEVSDFTFPTPCPMANGTLEVRGWLPSMEKLPAVILKNGDYKVEISYHLDGEIKYGLRYYASVVNIYF